MNSERYRLFSKDEFKIGERVVLVTSRHGDTTTNPIWGGKYGEIVGTIMRHTTYGETCNVSWDNGYKNVYCHEDLQLFVNKEEDNSMEREYISGLNYIKQNSSMLENMSNKPASRRGQRLNERMKLIAKYSKVVLFALLISAIVLPTIKGIVYLSSLRTDDKGHTHYGTATELTPKAKKRLELIAKQELINSNTYIKAELTNAAAMRLDKLNNKGK